MQAQFEGIEVNARSLAGIATTLSFPRMSLTVDIGVCTPAALRTDTVAITHTHADHVAGLHQYLAVRRLYSMPAPRIVAPEAAMPRVLEYIRAIGGLQGRPFDPILVGIRPGDKTALGKDLVLRAFEVPHASLPSLGYVVLRRVTKLRPEYLSLPGREIARLKKVSGSELFEVVEDPLVAITGDTLIDGVVAMDPTALRARVLFVECTFLGGRLGPEAAHLGGHVHLDELAPLIERIEARVIVLYHFSQTCSRLDLRGEVEARLGAHLDGRVRLLLPEDGERM